jgi:hypothetical protein
MLLGDLLSLKACSLSKHSPGLSRHVAPIKGLWRRTKQQQPCKRHTGLHITAVAAEAPEAAADRKRRGRPAGTQKKDPEISEKGMLDLPVVCAVPQQLLCVPLGSNAQARSSCLQATDYQQTLKRSFIMGGTGLHTGEYGEYVCNPLAAVSTHKSISCLQALHTVRTSAFAMTINVCYHL